jgi:hypothetical protein
MDLEGEGGLWVQRRGDSLAVHWLTADSAPGLLVVAGQRTDSIATPAGRSHRAALPDPGNGPLTLRYGLPGGLHTTAIDPAAETGRAGFDVPAVDSLYVVGDVHGAHANLVPLLVNAGLVDESLGWRGGRAHLVFDGDLVDRGPDATRILWLVYRLEREAARAGGRVHVVLGNHEIMAMAGDHRYVHPKERRIAECHGVPYRRLVDPRESLLGRWLATKPGILKVGDALLAHGGVTPAWAPGGLQAFNDSLAAFLHEDLMTAWFDSTAVTSIDDRAFDRRYRFLLDEESVFWFRGYVVSDTLGAALDSVLASLGARVQVVGHTPIPAIEPRYGGRLLATNTREFATEMVLIEQSGDRSVTWRLRIQGPPEPLTREP